MCPGRAIRHLTNTESDNGFPARVTLCCAMNRLTIAILGAGSGSRMRGGDKLLEPVDGLPLLRVLAQRGLETGFPVIVTIPTDAVKRRSALDGLDVTIISIPDADTGMSASFRALQHVTTDLLICLGDMPEITTAHMGALIAARDGTRPVRATSEAGVPGQPVLFPASLVARFGELRGDTGARTFLHDPIFVPLPGDAAVTDLDTPEDWTAWRAARRNDTRR
ncbi:molybdopterin-guanine dinucleotide biosynthesis protein MobA [Rhodobacteraceae bacterium THAF1]|nr:molybdopterin-guanine dinucleotide biosynthesis protein MobA [Palleronia sp. THAF1]VDC29259.1 molybdopterin-guanine dinucleotide biosynthesis protein MobA [Rhodobacteraceae bacterium THAF1]